MGRLDRHNRKEAHVIPSVEHVIKKRHHNRRRLRFLALILMVVAVISCGWAVLAALLVEHEWTPSMPLLVFAGGFVFPAIPLWLFDERIGRALVPMPKWECPGCRYNLTALERPICPECGLRLPALAVADKSPATGAGPEKNG
ncbi:MAG TPA: hypothetical protein VG269_00015 [Tepidisphaeraceae bacterium]|jgi:hypothetical protein|nr:hypothetical protein [Tepidisphaeraceae bacterium]